jgi:hypothetical protein
VKWALGHTTAAALTTSLVGDALLLGGTLTLLTPFPSAARDRILAGWGSAIDSVGIGHMPVSSVVDAISTSGARKRFVANSLPSDGATALMAGITIALRRRAPLLLDVEVCGTALAHWLCSATHAQQCGTATMVVVAQQWFITRFCAGYCSWLAATAVCKGRQGDRSVIPMD